MAWSFAPSTSPLGSCGKGSAFLCPQGKFTLSGHKRGTGQFWASEDYAWFLNTQIKGRRPWWVWKTENFCAKSAPLWEDTHKTCEKGVYSPVGAFLWRKGKITLSGHKTQYGAILSVWGLCVIFWTQSPARPQTFSILRLRMFAFPIRIDISGFWVYNIK